MTDTSAGKMPFKAPGKPALLGMRIDLDFYGFCLRLYSGFFGAGGDARAAVTQRTSAGVTRRITAVMERHCGESGGIRSGNSVGHDQGAGGAVWVCAHLYAFGNAGEGGARGFAGCGLERVATSGRRRAGYACARSRGTRFAFWH